MLQESLAGRVQQAPSPRRFRLVAAADVSADRFATRLFAGVVVYDRRTKTVVDQAVIEHPARFPYVPGLLSFREAPPVLAAFGALRVTPHIVICDGQGKAHPRRIGLACHLGIWLDLPTIGCAKSLLCGEHAEPGPARGQHRPLYHEGEIVGSVLRTREGCKPLYLSVGHRCNLAFARRAVLELTPRYRQPEPIRLAHALVNHARIQAKSGTTNDVAHPPTGPARAGHPEARS
jgi:deoxyribonuclease V